LSSQPIATGFSTGVTPRQTQVWEESFGRGGGEIEWLVGVVGVVGVVRLIGTRPALGNGGGRGTLFSNGTAAEAPTLGKQRGTLQVMLGFLC